MHPDRIIVFGSDQQKHVFIGHNKAKVRYFLSEVVLAGGHGS